MEKIKLGIFFGGPSKEREISFAGGRTVYDNLDKSIFEPVPIFIDSHKNLILLDWQYLYKGSIRDFYPPVKYLPEVENDFQIYIESIEALGPKEIQKFAGEIGRLIRFQDLNELIDVAFLALHGEFGEDGVIQAILESFEIPYTGSGILPSSIGIDKSIQKTWMKLAGFPVPKSFALSRDTWMTGRDAEGLKKRIEAEIGTRYVIRPANQGSSIGVSILNNANQEEITQSIDTAFFVRAINLNEWNVKEKEDKLTYISEITDIRDGIGMPLRLNDQLIYHPSTLLNALDALAKQNSLDSVLLEGTNTDQKVIVEDFLDGREFSCIVLRNEDGEALALPPTEIIKGSEVYDYRSKYLPGLSRKLTPIDLDVDQIQCIQEECVRLFDLFQFHTYARIDGFYLSDGTIYLNDPNTTSGMLPSSFFFHQAAELGLNPSQLISFIIRQSIAERVKSSNRLFRYDQILQRIDEALQKNKDDSLQKKKIAVILGGNSSERHISVESGRNIYEKLSSSGVYEVLPLFLYMEGGDFSFYQLPINLLLKDNADDIYEKIKNYSKHPFINLLRAEGSDLITKYSSISAVLDPVRIDKSELKELVDGVFIALHGRPGEDGEIQKFLQHEGIAFNGSGPESSSLTINKYKTLQLLKKEGFVVAEQKIIAKLDFIANEAKVVEEIESQFDYPFIAKPVDDGCSSAVVLIKSQLQLCHYLRAIFRNGELGQELRKQLSLKANEEFPLKEEVLIEERITAKGARKFLEITGGLLTDYKDEELVFEIFEPSEALAGEEILSLEEKFLAGEGQNITPARFSNDREEYNRIAGHVKKDFERAAKLLNVEGYARIDAFVRIFDDHIETIIIEVNSLPGMTPATCIFHQSAINGYKPFDFINKILNFAFEKNQKSLNVKSI